MDQLKRITERLKTFTAEEAEELASKAEVFAEFVLPRGFVLRQGSVIATRGNYDVRIYRAGKSAAKLLIVPTKSASGDAVEVWKHGLIARVLRELKVQHFTVEDGDLELIEQMFDVARGGWKTEPEVVAAVIFFGNNPEKFYQYVRKPYQATWEKFGSGIVISGPRRDAAVQIVKEVYKWA